MAEKWKVAIYIRLACNDDDIIETQKEKVMRFAAEHGYFDVSVYADNGESSSDFISRPALSMMTADIAAGKTDAVLTASIDRIGRDVTIRWVDGIIKKGVAFKTSDNYNNNDLVSMFNSSRRFLGKEYIERHKSVSNLKSTHPKNRGGARHGS
jgi:DNA invertase Pin-like site-specific DNA recombinase